MDTDIDRIIIDETRVMLVDAEYQDQGDGLVCEISMAVNKEFADRVWDLCADAFAAGGYPRVAYLNKEIYGKSGIRAGSMMNTPYGRLRFKFHGIKDADIYVLEY